ncbi:MAG: isoprenylcysteine carboxylmethyltransferase family protein, partial [Nanoarchaeota archaeon]
ASFFSWAEYTNSYFSSVVRIQKDRGQKVCQEGPYKYIRHPGYVGANLLWPSMGLIFGSAWSLIPSGILFVLTIVRTSLEDKTLQKELKGYKAYAKKVKYRLLPGVW